MNPIHSILTFVLLFVPFVLYVITKKYRSHKLGVVITCIATLIGCGVIHIFFDGLETPLIAAVALVLILSTISYTTNNALYFKLEPAIKSLITSCFLLIFIWMNDPFSIKLIKSLSGSELIESIGHEQSELLFSSPIFLQTIHIFEIHLIFWGLVYAGYMIYVAMKRSNMHWLVAKGAYMPLLLLPSALSMMIHLNYFAP